jgi:membrane associated rhomboid family serine protease
MIPIEDENPTRRVPYVNWALILVNVVVFIYTLVNGSLFNSNCDPGNAGNTICNYGLVPAQIAGGGELWTLITSMFLHGGLLHIGGNMLYLYIFGDNVEDLAGHAGYLLFYLTTGVIGALTHVASDPSSIVITIGASGAISGVLGAYVRKFPHARVRTIIYFGYFIRLTRVPAMFLIGFWFVYQLVFALLGIEGDIAYFAHVGGFIAGFLLSALLRGGERYPARY